MGLVEMTEGDRSRWQKGAGYHHRGDSAVDIFVIPGLALFVIPGLTGNLPKGHGGKLSTAQSIEKQDFC